MHASDVWIETLAISHEGVISSVDCCLPKMSPSSSTSTGSQIATWRRSLAWTRHDSTSISDYRRRERCSSDHRRFSLNPAQHDILPHRQSQLSDLTIGLHITTSLKSISQKRWLHHLIYGPLTCSVQSVYLSTINQTMSCDQSYFVLIGQNRLQLMSVMIIHKYVNIHTSVVWPQ